MFRTIHKSQTAITSFHVFFLFFVEINLSFLNKSSKSTSTSIVRMPSRVNELFCKHTSDSNIRKQEIKNTLALNWNEVKLLTSREVYKNLQFITIDSCMDKL